jgi:hypothetical protein
MLRIKELINFYIHEETNKRRTYFSLVLGCEFRRGVLIQMVMETIILLQLKPGYSNLFLCSIAIPSFLINDATSSRSVSVHIHEGKGILKLLSFFNLNSRSLKETLAKQECNSQDVSVQTGFLCSNRMLFHKRG